MFPYLGKPKELVYGNVPYPMIISMELKAFFRTLCIY